MHLVLERITGTLEQGKVTRDRIIEKGTFYLKWKQGVYPRGPSSSGSSDVYIFSEYKQKSFFKYNFFSEYEKFLLL